MIRAEDEEGLSEVVGFVLLLGVLVLALSVYQVYTVPAQGRNDEIGHMNDVKDRFIDYKLALDSLWLNNATGVPLSLAFDMGTGQATAQGGHLPLFTPTASAGGLNITEGDLLTIETSDHPGGWEIKLGALEYTSENHYWMDQTWTYQMGGIFLSQDDGTTLRLAPLFAVSNLDLTTASVTITPVTIKGSGSVSSTGPVRVETRLQDMPEDRPPYGIHAQIEWMRLSIKSSDPWRAVAWERALKEAPAREGIPDEWYQVARNGNIASITVTGPDPGEKDVLLHVQRADFYASLHGAAARIE
ncbi:hypothetical protein RJ40_09700 [Methanofollis aquaemaris]|uniref:Uncharacterized protein n=1 Tax=Methanofollis aquaemaris TaxID=126734 RepID=A0A8A3S6I1_9EURY|nr:hypothetical protein [Methanofollis aquaemaris]QSZ67755.1 hypothetical protein RJ40_09700 [Methanofollis aquaemaris]